jgi:hypothetical protein
VVDLEAMARAVGLLSERQQIPFLAPRAAVLKGWGDDGLAYCNHISGMAVVQIETNIHGGWPPCDDEELKDGAALRARRAYSWKRRRVGE